MKDMELCLVEIIETYWNVNVNPMKDMELCLVEIIETYWNVNSNNNCFSL